MTVATGKPRSRQAASTNSSRARRPVDGEREAPELVARVRVCAAEVEDDVGRVVEDARQMARERVEVFFVARPVVEFHVERRARLEERVVLRAVHREGEDRGVALEDGGGAVALMHVAIDDGRAL